MTENKLVVHFGAGSLGRGFVVPILKESGCRVIIADANGDLIGKLKETLSYNLLIADEEEGKQVRKIEFDGALSVVSDTEELRKILKEARTITTSVRQENLVHIAKTISEVWNDEFNSDRTVICCENLENASRYFKSLLAGFAKDERQKGLFDLIKVPDTMVDRGCSQAKDDPMTVYTESFYEIGVDKNMLPDTGIRLIPAVDDLQGHFFRKRFLLNTCVDSLAFLGLYYGLNNMAEAAASKDVQKVLEPYFTLVKKSLIIGYGMTKEEVNRWSEFYWKERGKKATGKSVASERSLDDVARDMWRKLEYDERFIRPLTILKDKGYTIDNGLELISMMVEFLARQDRLGKQEVKNRLEQMWCVDDTGKYIYGYVTKAISI